MVSDNDYIIEFAVHGKTTKINAIDPKTLKEASIQVPSHFPKHLMINHAVKKLEMIIEKQENSAQKSEV